MGVRGAGAMGHRHAVGRGLSSGTPVAEPPYRPLSLPNIRQRLYRGVEGLVAPSRKVDDRPALAVLNVNTLPLYLRLSKPDRAHSLRVLAWLRGHGHTDPDLLAAALLHDCGKAAAHIAVWQRTLKVLLKRLNPSRWRALSRPALRTSRRYPFYVLRHHPDIGADWAQQAGCTPTLVWLIRFHEVDPDPADPRYALMRGLQDADAAS